MVIKKTYQDRIKYYKNIEEQIKIDDADNQIEDGLNSILYISQNIPMINVADFFSGKTFSLMECWEELKNSYELIKFGFYKQSMISLRVGLDVGLLSIYWSIVGIESNEFKEWLSSNNDTPYKNKKFWNTLKLDDYIVEYDKKFNFIDEIKKFGNLSDFVHTKGIKFSNYGEINRQIEEIDTFQEWLKNFIEIVVIIEILHLLRFPTLNIRYSTEELLSKFGTFSRIPIMGCGYGGEMECIGSFISNKKLLYIQNLANNDEEVKYIKNKISGMPILNDSELRKIIMEEQKDNIRSGGFENWENSNYMYETRLTAFMIQELEKWAYENNLMTLDNIFKNHRKKSLK